MSSRLADQLIQERVITFDQLKAALEEKQRTGGSLEEALVSLGYLSEFQIAQYLGRLYGVPPVDLESIEIGEETLKLVPRDFAVANLVVPLYLKSSTLVVALPDPSNLMLVDDLRFVTGFNIEACVATERVIRDVIQRLYRLSPPSSEPVAQVEELPEAPELPTSESQLLWESGVEQATLRQEEGGFEFAVDEGKEAEDVVLNELLEPRDESVEAPSQPQLHWLFSSQESQDPKSASDVAMEQGVYEINPEEVEVPPSFFQTDVESVGEEEPGVYEISEEVLEEPSEFLGHIKEPSISSIPPEFMAPSQRRSQPRAYGVTLQESRPPTSSPLTEEAPCLQKDAEDAGATFKSEPLQMGTQSEIIEADERVVIDFYFPPGEALPQEVAFEEVEPETSQGASHEEPQASVQYPKESPTMTTQPPVHFSEEPMQGGYRGTVMVVDDSPTVQKIVAITLEREGYRVVGVDNAMQALAKFEEFVPDVILLDINLPYIDGYQLCKIIKGNPLTKSASVIMLTGKDGFFDKVKGKLAGASEYITKPFQPNYLVETVRRHTSGRL